MRSRVALSQLIALGAMCALPLCISACGGGGSPTPTQPVTLPATNRAPQFTSSATASIVENSAATLYTAAATDPDGDTPSFTISGPDAAAFVLSGADIAFRSAPDFERPTDSDRDNVYNITLGVSDGRGGAASQSVNVTVTNDKEGIAVRRIATGFTDPVAMSSVLSPQPPFSEPQGRIAVGQANGEIYMVYGTYGSRTLVADVFAFRPRGRLLDITYNKRRTNLFSGLYAIAQEPSGRVFVQRFMAAMISDVEILPAGTPPISAKIFEGPDRGLPGGDLFVIVSDESGNFAQDPNSRRGKLLFLEELDPLASASLRPNLFTVRVVGSGIRRSGGAGAIAGQILLADQGAAAEHELTFFTASDGPFNFGWPGREGTQGIGSNPPASVNGPRLVYGFGSGRDEGTGIVYGGLYQGPIASLRNRFVFGDRSGKIWSVLLDDLTNSSLLRAPQLERRTEDFVPDLGRIESPLAFTVDDLNQLFILDADGELFRVDGG